MAIRTATRTPPATPKTHAPPATAPPAGAERVTFTSQGETIVGWLFPAAFGDAPAPAVAIIGPENYQKEQAPVRYAPLNVRVRAAVPTSAAAAPGTRARVTGLSQLGEDLHPELGALGLPEPDPEHVTVTVDGDPQGEFARLPRDAAALADLQHQGVEEQHRVDVVEAAAAATRARPPRPRR